jgi:hypothetical protein
MGTHVVFQAHKERAEEYDEILSGLEEYHSGDGDQFNDY